VAEGSELDGRFAHRGIAGGFSKEAKVTSYYSEPARAELLSRLRRIEGQAQGVQRMIEEGRDCRAVLDQLNSIRSATYGACMLLMKHYALDCLRQEEGRSPEQTAEELVDLLLRVPH
jgi:DNA-binding FrmR family transcriptional regulator